ncbi:uncharacterized protein C8orf74 homolog [Mobula hypostoma]|uniref:uncharacterized protein C8orf74 homolog n=1 Tax=Mobula hypostoma TaxID=723540 RepID=UPI002FC287F7
MSWLTVEDLWQVIRLQKEDGRRHLTKLLKWEDFDEERDLKPGILLDYLYDTIIFAADKGFPWPSVAVAVCFSQELLCETKGKTIQEAIGKLWDKCEQYQNKLNSNYLQHLANYLLGTFFKHYHLYQFVLCKLREVDQTIHKLVVHVPQEVPPLKNGTDIELWEYQQQLAKLSEAEAQLRNGMSAFREDRLLKSEQEMDKFYKDLKFQNREVIDKAKLEEIVKVAHNMQMTATSEVLQKEIETTFQILDVKLQKTTIPVPASKHPQSSSMMGTKARKSNKKK